MGNYPAKDSIAIINGVMVVKFGDYTGE